MRLARPRAVCFDFDSTLIDNSGFRESIRHACRVVAAAHPPLEAETVLAANTTVWEAYWPSIERRWELGGISGSEVSMEGWRRTLRAVGCAEGLIEEIAVEACEVQRVHRSTAVKLFADTEGVLEALTKAGFPLALPPDAPRADYEIHSVNELVSLWLESGWP